MTKKYTLLIDTRDKYVSPMFNEIDYTCGVYTHQSKPSTSRKLMQILQINITNSHSVSESVIVEVS